MFRGYSAERRDRAPLIETEDYREEGARRFWDDFSPPYFGFKKGPNDTWTVAILQLRQLRPGRVQRYCGLLGEPHLQSRSGSLQLVGLRSIYFTDEDADGRQDSSEVCRVSGKVDAMRLPKEIYFAYRVIQNPQPDLHILGHWSYPATQPDGTKTSKTVYVSPTPSRSSVLQRQIARRQLQTDNGWIFAFPAVDFVPGTHQGHR